MIRQKDYHVFRKSFACFPRIIPVFFTNHKQISTATLPAKNQTIKTYKNIKYSLLPPKISLYREQKTTLSINLIFFFKNIYGKISLFSKRLYLCGISYKEYYYN